MSQQGWIKIHRKIKESWIWTDKPYDRTHAWLDLLLRANHQDNETLLGSELIKVKRGSFITSELKLCDAWGWSKTKLRNFLKLLEKENMIQIISDKKKTTINIVNYSVYQDCENHEKTTEKPQEDHEKTMKRPQKNTNKNDKNVNNDKNVKKYIDLKFIDEVVDNVHISEEQYDKLVFKFGKELIHKNIIALDNYIANNTKGKAYKDHYKVLNTWCNKDASDNKKQPEAYVKKESNFNNFKQRDYDFDDLERKLLGWDKEGE